MGQKRLSSTLLPLLGLIVVLAISFGGEMLFEALGRLNVQLFDITLTLFVLPWFAVLMTLLSTGAVLLLFWGIMTKPPRSRLVGITYLVVGFLGVAYWILRVYASRYLGLNLPLPLWASTVIAPNTPFAYIAGGMAVIGLFVLLRPTHE